MNLTSNELFKAVRTALYTGTAAAVALTAAPAFAQDQGDTQSLETVTVTGSRIRKADVETAQPILVMDRATIEKQGFNSVADILQNLSEAGSPPISRSSVLASGEAVGGYYIDLRNLGNNRTLVLLNGKRLGATTGGDQDLSQVPMAAIERIEVLKDGASAIYGSDAIAGVVNIITRSHYSGAEASAYIGQYDQDDGVSQTYSMTFGANSDRGSITLAAEYSKEDPTWAKDRWFSRYSETTRHPYDSLTVVSQFGAFDIPGWDCGDSSPYGLCTLNPGGNPLNRDDWHGTNSLEGTDDLTNSNEAMMLQTGIERKAIFVSADYSITDNIRFQTDMLYNHRETTQQVAGYPMQLLGFSQGDPYGNPLSAYSYYNPVGYWHNPEFDADNADDYEIFGYRRGWDVPRVTNNQLTTYRFGGTLAGTFEIGDKTWDWDIGGFVNQNDALSVGRGDFSLVALNQAVGPSFLDETTGRVTCGTPDNPLPYGNAPGSCIPWNPLIPAGQDASGALSDPSVQQFLFPYYNSTGRTRTVDYSANISGPVFTLPAGDLAIAAGYEYRNETGEFIPDAFAQSGLSSNLSSGPTGGKYKVDEYYIEVDVPVLKDVPFFKELSFNVAGRYSDYSTFGDTTNGKFSLTWRPIDDLMVRGNYAQGFRAPTIDNLYGGIGGTFDRYSDPCDPAREAGANPAVLARCNAGIAGMQPGTPGDFHQTDQSGRPCQTFPCQTATQFFSGSSPTLQPETATSKTLGMVYSPKFVDGLDFSLDWYNIRVKGAMRGDTVSSMLYDCYVLGVNSRCSDQLFQRDPTTGVLNYALRGLKNSGWLEAEGYDFGVNYRLPEFSFGKFALRWNTTYQSKWNSKADNEATTPVDPDVSFAGNFRIRSNASLDWSLGDFGATWTTRYYSSQKEQCSYEEECNMPDYVTNGVAIPLNRVGANTFHDVQVRYNAPWNGTISVGANNVFGHWASPMYTAPNSQYSYYGGFDIGRFYYLRYTQKF